MARKIARKSSGKTAKKSAKKSAPKKMTKKVTKKATSKPKLKIGPDGKPILPLGKGKLNYVTSNVFSQSLAQVWDAVTHSSHLKKHFIDDMIGEFGPDLKPVSWVWIEYGGFELTVTKFVKHSEIVFIGNSMTGKYKNTIRFEFLTKDGKTIFRIYESGYDPKDLKTAFMMCEGWTEFHCGVKYYLTTGNDPRKM